MMKTKSTAALLILSTLLSSMTLAGGTHDSHPAEATSSPVGMPGKAQNVTRTIDISMSDMMKFTPSDINVKQGETVRFLITNDGEIPHEFVIGLKDDLKSHAEMMRKMPDMKHAENNMVTLNTGQQSAIIWQFTEAGVVDFACLIPGHMEAGMVGQFTVR
ncbi:MAG: cupredoxin family protein [Porticoccus sp.]